MPSFEQLCYHNSGHQRQSFQVFSAQEWQQDQSHERGELKCVSIQQHLGSFLQTLTYFLERFGDEKVLERFPR